jgi:large subunit ribosomal protein L18
MGRKIRTNTNPRQVVRQMRKTRIRKKLVTQKGKVARLVVYRSNKFLYAQIVDDLAGVTLCQANTREKDFPNKSKKNLESAKTLGQLIGKRAKEKKLEKVVFDRNGYDFHGRIKAVADGAREAGLAF